MPKKYIIIDPELGEIDLLDDESLDERIDDYEDDAELTKDKS